MAANSGRFPAQAKENSNGAARRLTFVLKIGRIGVPFFAGCGYNHGLIWRANANSELNVNSSPPCPLHHGRCNARSQFKSFKAEYSALL
jgi:hypothetical protein